MKTNHGAVINKRMKDNYGDTLRDMTESEKAWAAKFEKLEYSIERGFTNEAIAIAFELNPNVSDAAIERIREDVMVKGRCNPVKAEADAKYQASLRKSDRRSPDTMYDSYDWHRNAGTMQAKDEDDAEVEKGITLNPEDALIEALDVAAKHGVNLETFINNTKYHTAERKAGRPKKVQE